MKFVATCLILYNFYLHFLAGVYSKRPPLDRFVIEYDVKRPIVGSYSYDPLEQAFEPRFDIEEITPAYKKLKESTKMADHTTLRPPTP